MDAEVESPPSPLTLEEARVLGCLIEKEITLPDYYPLTLNALVTACNQSSNRDPVMSLGESDVIHALESLKARRYVFQVTMSGARVQKFKHNIAGKFPRLEKPGLSLLCVLLLRGTQTVGELRQRTERLQPFPDLESVEVELTRLIEYPEGALVACLPAGVGRRVAAYAQLLTGEPQAESAYTVSSSPVRIVTVSQPAEPEDTSWKDRMEMEIDLLKAQVARLKAKLGMDD